MAESTRELLATGDVAAFVDAWGPALDRPRDASSQSSDGEEARTVRRQRDGLRRSAEHLLEIARACGVTAERVQFQVQSIASQAFGTVQLPLAGEPSGAVTGNERWHGRYEIDVGGLVRENGAWRIIGGVRWRALPPGIATGDVERELAVLARVDDRPFKSSPLSSLPDPALTPLAEAFVALLRSRSETDFVPAVTMGREEQRRFEMKIDWGTAEETEESHREFARRVGSSARAIVGTLERLGIDLSDAEIRVEDIKTTNVWFGQWTYGSLDGLSTRSARIRLTVRSTRKAANGNPLSGEYVIASGSLLRNEGRWVLMDEKARFFALPRGVGTKEERARIEFENHVIAEGTLPLGAPAPEIEFMLLSDEKRARLSDYRGKVVVLEFWASWCGPCQAPMTKLQKLIDSIRTGMGAWRSSR